VRVYGCDLEPISRRGVIQSGSEVEHMLILGFPRHSDRSKESLQLSQGDMVEKI